MGFIIDLASSISGLPAGYQQAIDTAIDYFETTITTNMTVTLAFDWGALGSNGPVGESDTHYIGYTYAQVYQAIQNVDGSTTASSVQRAAANTLEANFPTDPTNGGQFEITTADARALGLNSSYTGTDSTITLNSSDQYTWSQTGGIASGTYDAVGTIEHEISEALGRTAFLGEPYDKLFGGSRTTPVYNILDMFHYAAAGNASNAAPGAAAGALDEPFVCRLQRQRTGLFFLQRRDRHASLRIAVGSRGRRRCRGLEKHGRRQLLRLRHRRGRRRHLGHRPRNPQCPWLFVGLFLRRNADSDRLRRGRRRDASARRSGA